MLKKVDAQAKGTKTPDAPVPAPDAGTAPESGTVTTAQVLTPAQTHKHNYSALATNAQAQAFVLETRTYYAVRIPENAYSVDAVTHKFVSSIANFTLKCVAVHTVGTRQFHVLQLIRPNGTHCKNYKFVAYADAPLVQCFARVASFVNEYAAQVAATEASQTK